MPDYTAIAARYGYTETVPFETVYKDALRDLIDAGHSRPSYDPLNENSRLIFHGKSFLLYSLEDEHVYIDFIFVQEEDRGQGLSTLLATELEELAKTKKSWPKVIRATIVQSNEASLGAFKEYSTRSVVKEKHIV